MLYRLILLIFLWPHVGNANSFADYKINPKTFENFQRSLKELHPQTSVTKIQALNGESVDLVFHVYLSGGQDYFVRFFRRKSAPLNRLKIKVTQVMSKIWGGPEFIASAKDNKSFVTKFIVGRHLALKDFKNNPRLLIEFIDKLRHSHAYLKKHIDKGDVPDYPMAKRTQNRLKEIKDRGVLLPAIEQVEKILNFIQDLDQQQNKQVVHNDMRPENILLDATGNTYLIDWAELTHGNIYDDLGAFAEFFKLNTPLEKKVLKRYFNKVPSSDNLALLRIHRWINGLHRAAFKFRKQLESKENNPKSWKQALNSDKKDLKQAAENLQVYLNKVDAIEFRNNLEKIGFQTNISIMERVILWLKTLVKDA